MTHDDTRLHTREHWRMSLQGRKERTLSRTYSLMLPQSTLMLVADRCKIFLIWSQIFLISPSLRCRRRGSCATELWIGDQNEEVYFENSDNLHILVCTGLSRSIECRYPNIFVDCGKLLVRAAAAYKNFPPYLITARESVLCRMQTHSHRTMLLLPFLSGPVMKFT